jgi:hypothetical protein
MSMSWSRRGTLGCLSEAAAKARGAHALNEKMPKPPSLTGREIRALSTAREGAGAAGKSGRNILRRRACLGRESVDQLAHGYRSVPAVGFEKRCEPRGTQLGLAGSCARCYETGEGVCLFEEDRGPQCDSKKVVDPAGDSWCRVRLERLDRG